VPLAEKALVEEILAACCDAKERFVALQFAHPMVPPDPDDDNGIMPHDDKEASKGEDEIKTDDRDT
jgi:hypothetical protein